MKKFELFRFQTDVELARAAATDWLAAVREASPAAQPFHVALSGGRIAKTFFQAATTIARAEKWDLHDVHFFWADERCVPPDSPDSNFALAAQWLLHPLAVPEDHIHRIPGEFPPETAVLAAAREIHRIAELNETGQPRLDLVLLGMGEDGHIASLFPGTPTEGSGAVYQAVEATKPPPQRITLTFGALEAARAVWVLASGQGKEEALRISLEANGRTPLGELMRQRGCTRIYTDIAF